MKIWYPRPERLIGGLPKTMTYAAAGVFITPRTGVSCKINAEHHRDVCPGEGPGDGDKAGPGLLGVATTEKNRGRCHTRTLRRALGQRNLRMTLAGHV
jgi:hypothetical protein